MLLGEVGGKSALVISRVSHLKEELVRMVDVLGTYVLGGIVLLAIGRGCRLKGGVRSRVLTFTFSLSTRVRHSLVSRHAHRKLTHEVTSKRGLKHPVKKRGSGCGLAKGRRGVGTVLRTKADGTRVTEGLGIDEGALTTFLGEGEAKVPSG